MTRTIHALLTAATAQADFDELSPFQSETATTVAAATDAVFEQRVWLTPNGASFDPTEMAREITRGVVWLSEYQRKALRHKEEGFGSMRVLTTPDAVDEPYEPDENSLTFIDARHTTAALLLNASRHEFLPEPPAILALARENRKHSSRVRHGKLRCRRFTTCCT